MNNKQTLHELGRNLERFAKATDPRNILVTKKEIGRLLNQCDPSDKELLAEMSDLYFRETRPKYEAIVWGEIDFLFFGRIVKCVDCYIGTREEALDYLSEGEILRQVLFHLMKKYKISAEDIRKVRKEALVETV